MILVLHHRPRLLQPENLPIGILGYSWLKTLDQRFLEFPPRWQARLVFPPLKPNQSAPLQCHQYGIQLLIVLNTIDLEVAINAYQPPIRVIACENGKLEPPSIVAVKRRSTPIVVSVAAPARVRASEVTSLGLARASAGLPSRPWSTAASVFLSIPLILLSARSMSSTSTTDVTSVLIVA